MTLASRSKLSPVFHASRLEAVRERMAERGLDALVIGNPISLCYVFGYWHLPGQRALALVVPANGDPFALLPSLEADHFRKRCPLVADIETYFDYPEAGWEWVVRRLVARGLKGQRVGVDLAGLVMTDPIEVWETFRDLLGEGVVDAYRIVQGLRLIKQPEEVEIFETASRYSDALVGFIFGALREGITEYEAHMTGLQKVTAMMIDELPEIIDITGYGVIDGSTLFGQLSALPHGRKGVAKLETGMQAEISYGVAVCAYSAETERTTFFGQPSPEKRAIFEVMREAGQAAMDTIRPGVRCCEVDAAARKVIEADGLGVNLRHRCGHGKGLELHEHPYFERSDQTLLEPGMVFSVEPGIYIPGQGGFRHSETVVVTETGYRCLTKFPRVLGDLVRDS